jgi:chlorobactene lauroyltransferase
MIPARKFPFGQQLVWWLIHSSLSSHFDRVFFRMSKRPAQGAHALPIIVCANHSSWWDGYIAALVERQTGIDTYLMMEEAQLKRYFFFSWAGCFSVDRSDGRSAMQSLKYAARLLKEQTGRMVWLFPQGEIAPNDRRPLVFYSGAAHLARMATPTLLYPLASRIEYLAEQRPDLFISLGEPIRIDGEDTRVPGFLKICTARLEELVTKELDRLRDDVIDSDYSSFTRLMDGRPSTNRIFDTFFLRKQLRRQ